MDQILIGTFLSKKRKEKNMTQDQYLCFYSIVNSLWNKNAPRDAVLDIVV